MAVRTKEGWRTCGARRRVARLDASRLGNYELKLASEIQWRSDSAGRASLGHIHLHQHLYADLVLSVMYLELLAFSIGMYLSIVFILHIFFQLLCIDFPFSDISISGTCYTVRLRVISPSPASRSLIPAIHRLLSISRKCSTSVVTLLVCYHAMYLGS